VAKRIFPIDGPDRSRTLAHGVEDDWKFHTHSRCDRVKERSETWPGGGGISVASSDCRVHHTAMAQAATKTPTELLAGLVDRVTFHNEENGFCVLRVKARGQRDLITVVGHAATISAAGARCQPRRTGSFGARGLAGLTGSATAARLHFLLLLPEVAAGQFDVAVLSQLTSAQLPLRSHLKPGALQVVGFDALLRGRAMAEQAMEYASRDTDDAAVLADRYAELDRVNVGVPACVRREAEEHGLEPRIEHP
jgi:hypothetical protein